MHVCFGSLAMVISLLLGSVVSNLFVKQVPVLLCDSSYVFFTMIMKISEHFPHCCWFWGFFAT